MTNIRERAAGIIKSINGQINRVMGPIGEGLEILSGEEEKMDRARRIRRIREQSVGSKTAAKVIDEGRDVAPNRVDPTAGYSAGEIYGTVDDELRVQRRRHLERILTGRRTPYRPR